MKKMITTHFNNLSLGQHPLQVNVVEQPPSWCDNCGVDDHGIEVCCANPYKVNLVGNAHEYEFLRIWNFLRLVLA